MENREEATTEVDKFQDLIKGEKGKDLILFRLLKTHIPSITFFLILFVLWRLITMVSDLPTYLLPRPVDVFHCLTDNARWQWHNQVLVTTIEILGGFALAAVLGIVMGVLVAWSKFTSKMILPFLVFFNSLPKIAMAPLFLIWLGYGIIPNIWISFFVSFFPVAMNTATGVLEIDPEMVELARLFKASKWTIYSRVRIPHALPYIFAGLKVATSLAVIGTIVGEFIVSSRGLVALIMQAQTTLATEAIFGALLWISALGLGLFGLVSLLQKLLTPWSG